MVRPSAQASPSYNSASTPNLKANTSRWLELLNDTEADNAMPKNLQSQFAKERDKENDAALAAQKLALPNGSGMDEHGAERPAPSAVGPANTLDVEQARRGGAEHVTSIGGEGGLASAGMLSPSRHGSARDMANMNGTGAAGGSKWCFTVDEYEFVASRAPEELRIPAGMEVRREWHDEDAGMVAVTFLDGLDLAPFASAADGRGAEAVARLTHRFLKISGPWEVELSGLRARVRVVMRSLRLEQVLSNARNLHNMQDNFKRALNLDNWSMEVFKWMDNGEPELKMEWAPCEV